MSDKSPKNIYNLQTSEDILVDLGAWLDFGFKLDDDLIALVKRVKYKEKLRLRLRQKQKNLSYFKLKRNS